MLDQSRLRIGQCTDAGMRRQLNEDAVGTPALFHIDLARQSQSGALVAIADGMGGHAAGEIASTTAIQALFDAFYSRAPGHIEQVIAAGFAQANHEIYAIACGDCEKENMGTTLVAAVIYDEWVYIANVGDSRAYLVRGGEMRQITDDHSWVAEQVRSRALTPEQANTHVYRHIITRAVGHGAELEVDLFRERLESHDILLLCSDGLSNKVTPEVIRQIAIDTIDPDEAARQLVDAANANGGEDNISVVVARVPDLPPPSLASWLKTWLVRDNNH